MFLQHRIDLGQQLPGGVGRLLCGVDVYEGAVSHYVQQTTFGKTWMARNVLLVMVALGLLGAPLWLGSGAAPFIFAALALGTVMVAVVGRALFYVLVVPTTMPGAFFWKNKGFEQHARDIGLAAMPQVGVVPDSH